MMNYHPAPDASLVPRTDLDDGQVNRICDVIREHSFAVHRYFGPGFRERVYERSLIRRLRGVGLDVVVHPDVMVYDEDGSELIEETLDLVIESVVILELKAKRVVEDRDVAQLLGYLRATAFRHGLLINFGASKFSIKKYVM